MSVRLRLPLLILLLGICTCALAQQTGPETQRMRTGPTENIVTYGWHLELVLVDIVTGLRTILFFVLIIGLMWFVAMFVSGRPAVKPIVTVLVAAVMLGGIQVILNTFLKTSEDTALNKSPPTILQTGP